MSSCASPSWLSNAAEALSLKLLSGAGTRACSTSAGTAAGAGPELQGPARRPLADDEAPGCEALGPKHDNLPGACRGSFSQLTTTAGLRLQPSTRATGPAHVPEAAGASLLGASWPGPASPFLAATPLPPPAPDFHLAPAPPTPPASPQGPGLTDEAAAAAAPPPPTPLPSLLEPDTVPLLSLSLSLAFAQGAVGAGAGAAVACTASEPSALLILVQQVANSYELVHSATGLPWAASIPLTTLALRLALLPLSLRQARIIRSNFSLYREAVALTDQQEREQAQQQQQRGGAAESEAAPSAPASAAGAGAGLPLVLHSRLLRSHAVLSNFEMLRRKVDAPHPAWLFVNPAVQIPVFVAVSSTLGIMCRTPWPGLSREGALWFPDLTLPALVMESGEMPMGAAGLVMPLLVYGMTMTSLRLGFGASGLAGRQQQEQATGAATPNPTWGVPDTTLAAFLRSLAPVLYGLTTANLYFKVQMAHGVLVHWATSTAFTLSLQLALRNPALRALLKLNKLPSGAGASSSPPKLSPQPASSSSSAPSWSSSVLATIGTQAAAVLQPAAAAFSSSRLSSSSSSSSDPRQPQPSQHQHHQHQHQQGQAQQPGADQQQQLQPLQPDEPSLPPELVARVAETDDPNVLVIMGAQLSARHHYAGALHCLRRAVALNPGHVRAHYSMGQVHSLTGCWSDAESSYRAAAELSPEGPERGQAWYCVATALHSQGKLDEAAAAYVAADAHWRGQAVISYGRANALAAAGRRGEALAALAEAEARDGVTAGRPFRPALQRLRAALEGPGEGQAAAAVVAGDGRGAGAEDGRSH